MKNDERITLRLPAALLRAVKEAAEADCRTLSSFITKTLTDKVGSSPDAKKPKQRQTKGRR